MTKFEALIQFEARNSIGGKCLACKILKRIKVKKKSYEMIWLFLFLNITKIIKPEDILKYMLLNFAFIKLCFSSKIQIQINPLVGWINCTNDVSGGFNLIWNFWTKC